jgi:hypothetical protein
MRLIAAVIVAVPGVAAAQLLLPYNQSCATGFSTCFEMSKNDHAAYAIEADALDTAIFANSSTTAYPAILAYGDIGVRAQSLAGSSTAIGVDASGQKIGVRAATGLSDFSTSFAVQGTATSGIGVYGQSSSNNGVSGKSASGSASGVYGENTSGYGVAGRATGSGTAILGDTASGYAGWFTNVVVVTATLYAYAKYFKIDHPSDPANKFLNHASVESSEYKNFYDGVVKLGSDGRAVVQLPSWFEVVNQDFRYGLTPIGSPASLYISREISGGSFEVAGGQPGMRVSWSVTGVRKDPYVVAHPLVVEEDKPADKKGTYLIPALYGQPASKSYMAVPSAPDTASP